MLLAVQSRRASPPSLTGPILAPSRCQVAANKFHSVALGADGRCWTWGHGRGGRLGHPDFEVHSGQHAVIFPRVVVGLGKRQVVQVAAAKHHTLAMTDSGELFSWGSNKDGRLGYANVDTQPVPKRVIVGNKARVVGISAGSKHSAAVTAAHELFTWGSNSWGQLG